MVRDRRTDVGLCPVLSGPANPLSDGRAHPEGSAYYRLSILASDRRGVRHFLHAYGSANRMAGGQVEPEKADCGRYRNMERHDDLMRVCPELRTPVSGANWRRRG